MKKLLSVLAVLFFLGILAFVAAPSLVSHDAPAPVPHKRVIDKTKPTLGVVRVSRVIDGDTIEIEGGERVRYIGMNTPETVDPRRPVQCFGKEASNKNKELVEGKNVRLEKDISERDKYGRLLRYVFLGDQFINLELVNEGYAYADTFPPDVKHQEEFLNAQRAARNAKRGLWAECPVKK